MQLWLHHLWEIMELPFSDFRMLDFVNYHAYISGIVFLYPGCRPYLYTNYLSICSNKDPGDLHCDFSMEYEYFADGGMTQQFILKSDNMGFSDRLLFHDEQELWNVITRYIDNKYYVHGNLNEKYIPGHSAYDMQCDFGHDYLITGYNDENRTLIYIGYDTTFKIRKSEISISDFWTALVKYYQKNDMVFFKVNSEFDFSFNISKVIKNLDAYLYSKPLYDSFSPKDHVFGLEVMRKLMRIFLVEGYPIAEKGDHDMIFMRALLNHKAVLKELTKYLFNNKYISNQALVSNSENCFRQMNILYMSFLKWFFTKEKTIRHSLYKRTRELILLEESYLQEMYQELTTFFSGLEKLPYAENKWLDKIDNQI